MVQVNTRESSAILTWSFAFLIPPAVPDTKVWIPEFAVALEVPTSRSNVLVVTDLIVNHLSLAGSVDLGYVWLVACTSLAHVNVNELSSNLTFSPTLNPWLLTCIVRTPVD